MSAEAEVDGILAEEEPGRVSQPADAEVEEADINPAPVHQYCHKGTNCAGIQSQS